MRYQLSLVALVSALSLVGCGNEPNSSVSPRAPITGVKVIGDSLADSGTFGVTFTVKTTDTNVLWPEKIAALFTATPTCNFFTFTGASFAPNDSCNNFATASARLNNSIDLPVDDRSIAATKGDVSPFSIKMQLTTATNFITANDLVLIDGGGNDAADIITAFLGRGAVSFPAYVSVSDVKADDRLLSGLTKCEATQELPLAAFLPECTSAATAVGNSFMVSLAKKFAADVNSTVMTKSPRVAILNMPGVTNTPKLNAALDQVQAAVNAGALQANLSTDQAAAIAANARAEYKKLFEAWVSAYNTELAAQYAGNANVIIVDFYTAFAEQVSTPAQFKLSNVTTPACGALSLQTGSCTAAILDATTPTWRSYAFADAFHPTPYGHQLVSQLLARSLAQAGWL